jgi:hypothetical protein
MGIAGHGPESSDETVFASAISIPRRVFLLIGGNHFFQSTMDIPNRTSFENVIPIAFFPVPPNGRRRTIKACLVSFSNNESGVIPLYACNPCMVVKMPFLENSLGGRHGISKPLFQPSR